jgi:uncharacterized membrane protein YgdD (TMEM256/DUF423 family)
MPTGLDWFARSAVALAGILGAAGIAAAAGVAHTGDAQILGSVALVALTQAPALLALGLYAARSVVLRIATALIGLGALVFSADLAALHFMGASPVPVFAPAGGTAMIAGWLVMAVWALFARRA